MKIDRTRFLFLTGAMAAAACTINSTATDGGTTTPPATDAGHTGDATVADSATDAATDDASEDPADALTKADVAADTGPTCDDSVGTAGACGLYADGGADTGIDGGNMCLDSVSCHNVTTLLKPRVAQKAIECIVGLPTCEGDFTPCFQAAFDNACPDTSGAAACATITAACGDASAGDAGLATACGKISNGLTAAGRTKFVACMTESCSDIAFCAGQFF